MSEFDRYKEKITAYFREDLIDDDLSSFFKFIDMFRCTIDITVELLHKLNERDCVVELLEDMNLTLRKILFIPYLPDRFFCNSIFRLITEQIYRIKYSIVNKDCCNSDNIREKMRSKLHNFLSNFSSDYCDLLEELKNLHGTFSNCLHGSDIYKSEYKYEKQLVYIIDKISRLYDIFFELVFFPILSELRYNGNIDLVDISVRFKIKNHFIPKYIDELKDII